MALKPLAGSRRSVWFVARKVSVFLTACAVGSGGTQKEQVAEWEMCVFLELCFLGFPGNQYYLPSQLESCVVSSFGCCWPLAYVHKKAGKGVFLPCQGIFLLLCQRWWRCSGWLQHQLFCNLPWKISLAVKFCGHIKVTPHPLTGGGWAVGSDCREAFALLSCSSRWLWICY